jgi:hypothetical protein
MTPSPKNSEIPQTSPTENTDITTFTREQLRQLKQEIQT